MQHALSVSPYLSHFLYNITLSWWLSFRPMQHGAFHSSLPYALHPLIIDKQSTRKANNGTAVGSHRFALIFHESRGLERLCFGTSRCVYWYLPTFTGQPIGPFKSQDVPTNRLYRNVGN
jgi:hypothetical protein